VASLLPCPQCSLLPWLLVPTDSLNRFCFSSYIFFFFVPWGLCIHRWQSIYTLLIIGLVLSIDMKLFVWRQGAITKRMTAIEEMAGMDVLCSDKTGTLTLNKLTVDKNLVEVLFELRLECYSLYSKLHHSNISITLKSHLRLLSTVAGKDSHLSTEMMVVFCDLHIVLMFFDIVSFPHMNLFQLLLNSVTTIDCRYSPGELTKIWCAY
jgi:hypothetical protein